MRSVSVGRLAVAGRNGVEIVADVALVDIAPRTGEVGVERTSASLPRG